MLRVPSMRSASAAAKVVAAPPPCTRNSGASAVCARSPRKPFSMSGLQTGDVRQSSRSPGGAKRNLGRAYHNLNVVCDESPPRISLRFIRAATGSKARLFDGALQARHDVLDV